MKVAGAVVRFLAVAALVALALTVFTTGTEVRVPAEAYVFVMGGLVVVRLLAALRQWAPAGEPTGRPLLVRRRSPAPAIQRPPALTELEGLVAAALTSGRAAERRLRPRLAELAAELGTAAPDLGAPPDSGVPADRLAGALDALEARIR